VTQPYRGLRRLLIAHGVITFVAGVLLIVAPNLIPGAAGITLEPHAYLLAYLLAGAEFGFSALSLRGAQLTDALRLVSLFLPVWRFTGRPRLSRRTRSRAESAQWSG